MTFRYRGISPPARSLPVGRVRPKAKAWKPYGSARSWGRPLGGHTLIKPLGLAGCRGPPRRIAVLPYSLVP